MRLSRRDWIEAGLVALGEGGVAAVAVEPLAKRLAATKGSFYWHFTNRNDLFTAVLELWEQRETTQVLEALQALPDPRSRLGALGRSAYARASRGGAHAALLAAADDPRIAPVLQRVTHARLGALESLFGETGSTPEEARRRARLAYSVYLGIAALRRSEPDDQPDEHEIGQRVELFVDTVVPPAR